jgi:hypothetical protein
MKPITPAYPLYKSAPKTRHLSSKLLQITNSPSCNHEPDRHLAAKNLAAKNHTATCYSVTFFNESGS